ncbi:MAG: response regulator [Anaerolineae bacterium]|nr:response regulator [Anaerolineae bacterium]
MSPLILFVEDDEALRESASIILALQGYAVQVARDGLEALKMLNTSEPPPDLIVSDITMPHPQWA